MRAISGSEMRDTDPPPPRRWIVLARVSAVVGLALVVTALWAAPFSWRLESDIGLRALYGLRGTLDTPQEALIVGIDRNTISDLRFEAEGGFARMPTLGACLSKDAREALGEASNVDRLPRAIYACLIERLSAQGAELIVLDVLFNTDDRDSDPQFAEAIAASGRVLLFEHVEISAATNGMPLRTSPRAPFAEAALGTGLFLVNAPNDGPIEGVATRLPDLPDLQSLPRLAWSAMTGQPPPPESGTRALWLYGPPGTLARISLDAALADNGALPDLQGRAVFVGAFTPDIPDVEDHFTVAMDGRRSLRMSGVELMATDYLNRLHDQPLERPSRAVGAALVFGLALLLFTLPYLLRGRAGIPAVLGLALLTGAGVAFLFVEARLWLALATPLLIGTPLAVLLGLWLRYSLAREIVWVSTPSGHGKRRLDQGQAERDLLRDDWATVVFADLIASTKLAETNGTEAYATALQHYYDAAYEAVSQAGGMVVEYQGDGIYALFGRTSTGEDHAARALQAISALCRAVEGYRVPGPDAPWRMRLRIGVATGGLLIGDVGARRHFSYKGTGETVIVAHRLQELAREHDSGHGHIVLAEAETITAAGTLGMGLQDLGEAHLPGKTVATQVWRVWL
ncbi:MAG: adenylate/guanylate cyclase domain-containing protein [Pseudomonadota bacterium]